MTDQIDDGAWFLPRRYGYGAGFPFAWQGRALLGGYMAVIFALTWAIAIGSLATKTISILLFVLTTAMFVELTRRHTRGDWRWRWGDEH